MKSASKTTKPFDFRKWFESQYGKPPIMSIGYYRESVLAWERELNSAKEKLKEVELYHNRFDAALKARNAK